MNHPSYYQPVPPAARPHNLSTDLCVYGGTSGGIIAAIQSRKLGHSVVLLVFGDRLGGMTAGGLGRTDIGNKAAIGGLAREFYRELGRHYGIDESWAFEPGVAERTFERFLKEHDIPVFFQQHLESVSKSGNTITEITTEGGHRYRAKVFIDATYEGDLMAKAGVSYTVGREANAAYNETYNGIHFGSPHHNFRTFVDPYNHEGDPASGLLPGISSEDPGIEGEGDHRVQAYNFRLCLTKREDNRIPFPKPANYDPDRYTLLARYLQTGVWDVLQLTKEMPNEKTDTNNFGGFSTDNIGRNYEWPDCSYEKREAIYQDHVTYTQGMLWFLANDERVSELIRKDASEWGLPKDEFPNTGGWPHELYIREARRMVSDYVMTEHHCVGKERADDSIGLAAYGMDSHNCQRIVKGGRAFNEGDVQIAVTTPYPISYRSIVPRESECANLVVPFCLSASHIAFGSIRMEAVFMILSQSAATAAHLAICNTSPVQKVDYPALRKMLLADNQALDWTNEN